ncbi:glycosyltransferase family 4 protein [Phaeovulum sp.]|uniref:glycosyltransferase family 4 protein n=1 Tax=Phaeovulum sp. TaxID=2934796 RepID=UPI0035614DB1
MRVLHIFHGQYVSGAELVAFDCLGKDPDREDHAVILCASERLAARLTDRLGAERVLALNLPLAVGRLGRWLLFNLLTRRVARQLPRVLAARGKCLEQFDLVYYNNSTEVALAARLAPPCPEVCHVHDMVSTLPPGVRRAFRQGAGRCRHVLAVSHAAAREVAALLGPARPITTLYNAARYTAHMPNVRPATPLRRFAFFGGAAKRKGLDLAVSGLSLLADEGVNLDVYGMVPPRRQAILRHRARGAGLTFHGEIAHDTVAEAMRAADAVIVPSRRDPLPTVVLEALALGRPVIAASVDGVPEMIADSRFLFAPESPASIAACINFLNRLTAAELSLATENCARFAAERFRVETKCATLSRVLAEVVDDARRAE